LKYQRLQSEGFKKPKDLRIELKCAYCKYAKGFDMRRPLVHREYYKLLEHCNHVLQRTASDTSARTAAGPDDESLDSVSLESRGEPLIIIAAGAGEAASPNDVVDLTSDGDHHENNDNVPGAVRSKEVHPPAAAAVSPESDDTQANQDLRAWGSPSVAAASDAQDYKVDSSWATGTTVCRD
jgi:hypothetical protein